MMCPLLLPARPEGHVLRHPHLTVRGKPPVEVPDETLFFQVVRAAFAQRRKTLVNALSTLLGKRCG
ncbi:MAG: hypothetical protein ACLUNZ_03325 [Evtepia sp.]